MIHLRHALRLLLERPIAGLLGVTALALGLVLAGLSLWVLSVTGAASAAIEADVVLRARLDPKLDEAGTKQALLGIAAIEGVREVAWVGPEAQRQELGALLGEPLLAGLDAAVFPQGGLARVTLARGVIVDRDALDRLLDTVRRITAVEGVDDIPYDPRHLSFLFDAASVARVVGLGLALLALLSGALAVYSRVSLALTARARELELYRAFGATERWLMARYLALALGLGALSAALAIAVGLAIDRPLADLASLLPGSGDTAITSPVFLTVAVVGGLGLSALAGLRAVARGPR